MRNNDIPLSLNDISLQLSDHRLHHVKFYDIPSMLTWKAVYRNSDPIPNDTSICLLRYSDGVL
ncbi:hypothetical protein M513_10893 [Trichuris suis]|uniref:Uncharacterized protein n=1 Tax=Trichuris suis TaxID=68888 RepID=A0A085LTF4_9BILA|nr:hypothetical protein M513_10893 [Trichuris suis]